MIRAENSYSLFVYFVRPKEVPPRCAYLAAPACRRCHIALSLTAFARHQYPEAYCCGFAFFAFCISRAIAFVFQCFFRGAGRKAPGTPEKQIFNRQVAPNVRSGGGFARGTPEKTLWGIKKSFFIHRYFLYQKAAPVFSESLQASELYLQDCAEAPRGAAPASSERRPCGKPFLSLW